MRKALWWAAIMIGSPVLAEAPAANTSVDFSVGGVALTMPFPTGYCLPVGRSAAAAQLIAAGDPDSVTHVTLNRCNMSFGTGTNDYTLIKTPTAVLMNMIDRPTLIATLGAQYANPVAVAELTAPHTEEKASGDLSKVLRSKVELKSSITPLGHDDVCAYMGGQVEVKGASSSYLQPAGVCITSVAGKVVIIARYGTDLEPTAIVSLLREARAIAETLHPKAR